MWIKGCHLITTREKNEFRTNLRITLGRRGEIETRLFWGYKIGCANKDLWGLCAPIFIIVVYCRTATSYFLGDKE